MRVFQNAKYDFLGKRRTAYKVSGAIMALLTAAAIYFHFTDDGWLNYGVDFAGGTLIQVAVEGDVEVSDVREVVSGAVGSSEVTGFEGDNEFLVRAPAEMEDGRVVSDVAVEAMNTAFGAGNVRIDRIEAVGPKIGNELQRNAILALLVSFVFIMIYLAFRFEWRFGLGAIIATMHDIVLTLLLISVLRLEVSLTTVAAVLTIIGYSLNDTIVIFDRIRENRKALGKRMSSFDLMNRSVNETLGRTVITGGSTLLALLSLYILGGVDTLRDLALILILGIVMGTYSSIMIAAAALYDIELKAGEAEGHHGGRGHAGRVKETARAGV